MGTQVAKDIFSLEYTQAIFSVWDRGYMKPTGIGRGCTRFGGEGTGVKCIVQLPIRPYVKYSLKVQVIATSAQGQTWQGTISSGSQTTVIGAILLPNANGLQGWGQIQANGMG